MTQGDLLKLILVLLRTQLLYLVGQPTNSEMIILRLSNSLFGGAS